MAMEPAGGVPEPAMTPGPASRAGLPNRLRPSFPGLRGLPNGLRPTLLRDGTRNLAIRLARDVRALATPGGVRGTMVETAWVATHLALYPLGVLRERTAEVERYGYQDLTPRQRSLIVTNVEASSTPILLVHGMIDNRTIFTVLTRRLRAHGFERVVTLNYSPVTNDIRAAAEGLSAQVEALVARTGYERIHVVGHSLGGLIARYYVQRLGGDTRVHTLVTLGTPHHGTLAAHLVPFQLCRQLRPSSDLFAELDEPAPGCRTRFVAFWSDLDQLVVPHDNARLRHSDLTVANERVQGVGHMSLPINAAIVQKVAQVLGELNSDGSSLSAGVIPLRPS
ncbi:MAG TPA: alpha/beta fold hydrolase [Kineosporiaceae bacterium]|nr:alpha/beta fold hydrolase [Kineosporiaceae bacterium]